MSGASAWEGAESSSPDHLDGRGRMDLRTKKTGGRTQASNASSVMTESKMGSQASFNVH